MNRSERITQALMTAKSVGGKLELNRAKEAKKRAHGQIFPSKYMPGVPRQVRADGGRLNDEQKSENLKKWAHNIHPLLQDENGMPKKLYHGTASDIHSFRPSGTGEFGPGIYMTDLPDEAGGYAGTHAGGQNIMPVYAVMRNPFVVKNDPQEFWEKFGGGSDEDAMYNAMAAGHDGVIFRRPYTIWDDKGRRFIPTGQYHTHYVAFSPNQVKSASGNIGTFDPREKDIAKKDGGPLKLFHGTEHPDPIEQLDPFISPDQLGVHLGDAPTANRFAKRMNYDPRTNATRAPRVIPVHANIKNPLRLEDNWGTWEPSIVHQQLVKKGLMHQDHDLNERLMNLEQGMTEEGEDPHDERKAKQLQNHAIKFMHGLINQLGYDGIVYLNRFEMPTDEAKERLDKGPFMRGQLNKMSDEEFKDHFPEAVDSYIALDPKQIKSPFGEGSGVGYADGGEVKATPNDRDGDGIAEQAQQSAAQRGFHPDMLKQYGPEWQDATVLDHEGNVIHNAIDKGPDFKPTRAVQLLPDGSMKKGIIAYHGTPHDFAKFDLSKIGTGEGAQAYGHGLYFAEHEPVAKGYRDALSPKNYLLNAPEPEIAQKYGQDVLDMFSSHGGDPNEIKDTINRLSEQNKRDLYDLGVSDVSQVKPQNNWGIEANLVNRANRLNRLQSLLASQDVKINPGHMYQAHIAADPEHFLDWDKPIKEQPEAVRRIAGWTPEAEKKYRSAESADTDKLLAALEGSGDYTPSKPYHHSNALVPYSAKGEELHQKLFHQSRKELQGIGGAGAYQANVAEKLRAAGIPGIKYLDAGSRGTGDGSRNYVVFDDNLINVLKKYAKGGFIGGENVDKLIKKAMLTARKAGSCHE